MSRFLSLVFTFCILNTFSQTTNISGIINAYSSVTNLSAQSATVSSATGFNLCDKVLIIQMKGASINSANSISYGTITSYNNAGNYEFAYVSNITGNVITFVNPLTRSYTVADVVQLIKVPVYNNANIIAQLNCQPWNGATGGVLVFEAQGTVTFNNDIVVDGAGFSGAALISGSFTCGGDTVDYSIASPSLFGAKKGEGIFLDPFNNLGKGKNASGGGGGNDINGGGAGGANFGSGGNGGFFQSTITCPSNFTLFCGGMGGQSLNYSTIANKIFLGSGGGAGHQNNLVGTAGANGGGMVIIKATSIIGNAHTIFANGNSALNGNIDGQGGGGSGGTVLLDVPGFSSLNISAKGGNGGSDAIAPDAHGKGGGGGGGVIWTSGSQAGITSNLSGGNPGIFLSPSSPYFNASFGAMAGQNGGTLTALSLTGISNSGITPTVSSSGNLSCTNATAQLSVLPNSVAYTFLWSGSGIVGPNNTPTINVNAPGTYTVAVTSTLGGCTGSSTINVISDIATLTLSALASSTSVCSLSAPLTLTASGATNYTWEPVGSTLPGNGPVVTANPSVTTIYTVTGTTGVCSGSTSITISVTPSPTIIASVSPTIICQGSTATLSAIGALTYTWQPGNLSGASVTVAPLTTTIYTVSGTNLGGCTSSQTVQLVVDNPTITVSPLSSSICIGQPATISASGATSYTWSPVASNASSIVVTPTITTTYTLQSTDGVCNSTNTVIVTVNPLPTVTAVSNYTAICDGGSATLTASGASTYTWNPVALFGTTISVSPTITTTYVVAGTSSLGCINAATVAVVVNANPTISATANPTFICSGFPSVLTATGATTYTWAPSGANGGTLVVTPSVTSTYTVAGTSTAGCVSSQTVSVTVGTTPTLNIVSSATAICPGNTATLIAGGATNYTWQPGALTGTSVAVSPTATTVYTIVGVSGNCSSTQTYTLIVRPRPNVTVNALPPVICQGGAGLLLAFGASTYTWNPGSTNGNTLVVTPSVTTTYTVTGTNTVGCTNTAVATVSVNANPTITTIPSSTLVCSGNTVSLSSTGGLTYLINPGAQTGSLVTVTPTVTTNYIITGINASGCIDSKTVTVNVNPSPVINATSSGTLLCDGGTFSLSASGAVNYTWMPVALTGSSVVTTATNAVSVYTVFGEASNGCIGSSTLSVLVINCNNSIFGMTKAAGKPILVYNTFYNVDFTVTAVNASSLTLSNITLNEDLSAAFVSPTNFTVISPPVVTSQNSSLTVDPLFDGISHISLTSPAASTLLPNKRDTLVFTVRVDPRGFYGPFKNWVIGFANVLNNVTVLDSSNNGFAWDPDHDGDPTNNDSVTVINLPVIDLFIPDAFSPNNDGKNDVFFIKGLNNRSVKLTVFNRWGNKVYEKSEYDNTWNAYPNVANTLGSDKVPPATYYYIIEFLDGDKETFTGYVVVQY